MEGFGLMRLHIIHSLDEATAERLDSALDLLGDILTELENLKMSFEDEVARAKAAEDAASAKLDAISADVDGLKAQIADLNAKIAAFPAPGLTPEQEAALKGLADGAEALAAKAAAVDDKTP